MESFACVVTDIDDEVDSVLMVIVSFDENVSLVVI